MQLRELGFYPYARGGFKSGNNAVSFGKEEVEGNGQCHELGHKSGGFE